MAKFITLKKAHFIPGWWLIPIIPATQEVEIQCNRLSRPKVNKQAGHGGTHL
jgi:hypothetical protein